MFNSSNGNGKKKKPYEQLSLEDFSDDDSDDGNQQNNNKYNNSNNNNNNNNNNNDNFHDEDDMNDTESGDYQRNQQVRKESQLVLSQSTIIIKRAESIHLLYCRDHAGGEHGP